MGQVGPFLQLMERQQNILFLFSPGPFLFLLFVSSSWHVLVLKLEL